jgi:Chromate resistance exported protein
VTFDAILEKYKLTDPALQKLALIVREADMGGDASVSPEAPGFRAILHGFFLLDMPDADTLRLELPCGRFERALPPCYPRRPAVLSLALRAYNLAPGLPGKAQVRPPRPASDTPHNSTWKASSRQKINWISTASATTDIDTTGGRCGVLASVANKNSF